MIEDATRDVALEYLNADPHPLALARHRLTVAENKCKEIFSRAFLAVVGSVDARKAAAEIDVDYLAAKKDEAEAIKELENERAKTRGAEMLLECWRTEQSNNRAMERHTR